MAEPQKCDHCEEQEVKYRVLVTDFEGVLQYSTALCEDCTKPVFELG